MAYERHTIEEIEGIGETWGRHLRAVGITATEDLLVPSEERLRARLGTIRGFPVARLREFICNAELLQVEGMTGQFAEAFYHANRRTLLKLAAPDPKKLVTELKQAVQSGRIPEATTLTIATRWQKDAVAVRYTGALSGIVECEGDCLEGVEVYCGTESAKTDHEGKFYLPIVPYGKNELTVVAPGYRRLRTVFDLKLDAAVPQLRLGVGRGEEPTETADESTGETFDTMYPEDRVKFRRVRVESVAEGSPLVFQRFLKSGASRLSSVLRKRRGNEILVDQVTAPAGAIVGSPARGTVFYWKGGKLVESKETLNEVRGRSRREALEKIGKNVKVRRVTRQSLYRPRS